MLSLCLLWLPRLLANKVELITSHIYWWRRGAVDRVSDLRSRGRGFESRPGTRRKNSGQVSHTYVPLSPSSTSWYRPKGGDALRLGEKAGTVCVSIGDSRSLSILVEHVENCRQKQAWWIIDVLCKGLHSQFYVIVSLSFCELTCVCFSCVYICFCMFCGFLTAQLFCLGIPRNSSRTASFALYFICD